MGKNMTTGFVTGTGAGVGAAALYYWFFMGEDEEEPKLSKRQSSLHIEKDDSSEEEVFLNEEKTIRGEPQWERLDSHAEKTMRFENQPLSETSKSESSLEPAEQSVSMMLTSMWETTMRLLPQSQPEKKRRKSKKRRS